MAVTDGDAEMTVDVEALYKRFFELGGPPAWDVGRPWQYRRRVTSLRMPGMLLLAEIVRARRPARVLDLGSGLTSILLRALIAEVPGMRVTSTDTWARWLACTEKELARDGLNGERCYLHEDFERVEGERFDLISVDIDRTEFRLGLVPRFQGWLAEGGVIVLDDWGMEFTDAMRDALEAAGFVVTPRPETLDEYGCFMAVAER